MISPNFTISRVEYRYGPGLLRAVITVDMGRLAVPFKVMQKDDEPAWVAGMRFGEPLKSKIKAAVLAAFAGGAL